MRATVLWVVWLLFVGAGSAGAADPSEGLVHGLWVWKSQDVLKMPGGAEHLKDFCQTQGITEVYVSYAESHAADEEPDFVHLIGLMHRARIRVEALLSSTEADEPGKHRDKLLDHVREVIAFNQGHRGERFDGIHLDIEPQQRPENKGSGNLRFLPDLADTLRSVRSLTEVAGMTANADIQSKLLKGDTTQRRMLLSSIPSVTLMMYELSSPDDGQGAEQKAEKAAEASAKFLDMAYDGLAGQGLARMAIALRTPDYRELLPEMLEKLDATNRGDPHYLGWARHSYNDTLPAR